MAMNFASSSSEGYDGAIDARRYPNLQDGIWVSAWIYPTSISGDPIFMCFGDTAGGFSTGHRMQLGLISTGELNQFIKTSVTQTGNATTNTATLNAWNHIYIHTDGTDHIAILNGDVANAGNLTTSFGSLQFDQITLGYMDFFVSGGISFMDGDLAHVAWGVGPHSPEMAAQLAAGKTPGHFRSALRGPGSYWKLDPKEGPLRDEWQRGNFMVPKNSPAISGLKPLVLAPPKKRFFVPIFTLFTKAISITATGTPAVSNESVIGRAFSYTATGVADIVTVVAHGYSTQIEALGTSSLIKSIKKTLSHAANGDAALGRTIGLIRSLTATGTPSGVQAALTTRSFSHAATAAATLATRFIAAGTGPVIRAVRAVRAKIARFMVG